MTTTQARALVTGLGATTPVGGDVAATWDSLLAGRSGVRKLTEDWADELPVPDLVVPELVYVLEAFYEAARARVAALLRAVRRARSTRN